jgi:hypothetical protein
VSADPDEDQIVAGYLAAVRSAAAPTPREAVEMARASVLLLYQIRNDFHAIRGRLDGAACDRCGGFVCSAACPDPR